MLFFSLSILGIQRMEAQVNIRVGYNVAKIQAEKNESLIKIFNESEPHVESGFPQLNILHGFELGLRYNFGFLGFDLGFSNLGRDRTASVFNVTDEVIDERELKYSFNNFSFGIENVFDRFGYGGSFGVNFFRVKSRVGALDASTVLSDQYWNSRFYLMWNLRGSDLMCLSIRPYVDMSWETTNLSPIQDDIYSSPSVPSSALDEKPIFFGISFLFYNGPKPRS